MAENFKNIYDIYKRLNDTMESKLCNQIMDYTSSKANFSTLKKHLFNKHFDVYRLIHDVNDQSRSKAPKLDLWATKNDLEFLPMYIPFIDRQAIAAVASRQILHLIFLRTLYLHGHILIKLRMDILLPNVYRI